MKQTKPWHARLALALAIFLPLYLAACALGTKFGLWGWQTGLGAFGMGGLALMAATAILALISIVLCARKPARGGVWTAVIALAVPLALAAFFAPTVLSAGDHPIHDIATDTSDPPPLSPALRAEREDMDANPINDYSTPLNETEQFEGTAPPTGNRNHAQIIAENYPGLDPLVLDTSETDVAVQAVRDAMNAMGMNTIRAVPETNTIEAVAETFWFGFRDDVIARITPGNGSVTIDFRSISRVGQSDLGKNAERIGELRDEVAEQFAD